VSHFTVTYFLHINSYTKKKTCFTNLWLTENHASW